jgi:hypothetical protein
MVVYDTLHIIVKTTRLTDVRMAMYANEGKVELPDPYHHHQYSMHEGLSNISTLIEANFACHS